MRVAELTAAAVLMALSLFFMAYAVELPIGWVPRAGPGGGAFPFWLSLVMLLSAAAIFLRELLGARARARPDRGDSPRAAGSGRFFAEGMLPDIALVCGALLVTIALISVVGAYVALPLFLVFHLRVVGRQGWPLTLALALATPVAVFFFFEVTLKILLPKGVTEPLFLPLYAWFF